MKKLVHSIIFILFCFIAGAQTTYNAQDILQLVSEGASVKIANATIVGDLDFTKVKKKFKGGSYGVRGGIAQEYFTRVTAPITFTSCEFLGAVLTKSELKVGREQQENFTNLRADVTFIKCVFNRPVRFESMGIKETVTFANCTFMKELKFEHVTFDKAPQLSDNIFNVGFSNRNTNWKADRAQIEKPISIKKNNDVHLTLHNPTMRSIKIVFGSSNWNLSPFGKSGVSSAVGTEIFILDGGLKRLAFTINESQEGSIIDISKF